MLPRLSKLEQRIILEIANHTINSLECASSFMHNQMRDDFISRTQLFRLCYSYWPDDSEERQQPHWGVPPSLNSRRVTFSRTLRRLLENKGLIGAMALSWHFLYKGGDDQWEWQGGGRYKDGDRNKKRPRYLMVCLSDNGWRLARELAGCEVGKCTEHAEAS